MTKTASLLAIVFVVAGCATHAPPPQVTMPTSPPITELPAAPPRLEILDTKQPAGVVDLAAVYMGGGPIRRFHDTVDLVPIVIDFAAHSEDGATHALGEAGRYTEFWSHDDDGSIVMPATIEYVKHALTRFDPPLLVAPARLEANTPVIDTATMVVVDDRPPGRQRARGRATQRIVYDADERITTPLGTMATQRVTITFHAALGFATAENKTVVWIAGGRVVARRETRRVRVLGVAGNEDERTLVLRP